MKKIILAVVIAGALGAGAWFLFAKKQPAPTNTTNQPNANTNTSGTANVNTSTTNTNTSLGREIAFSLPKKSAHYETNTPAHATTLAAVPVNVVIDFNFDLSVKSTISIQREGREYAIGSTTVDSNKLTLRRTLDPAAPDGLYTVNYNACWPDNSCHDGHFQFAIDRTRRSGYLDARGQTEVTIRMTELMFQPVNILIDKGTKVTWKNDDSVDHYVNTDSHPAHTYQLDQNSRALKPGDQYTYAFNAAGAFPYHCSAHADVMIGNVVVQ